MLHTTCSRCVWYAAAPGADAGVCQRLAADVLRRVRGPIGDLELAANVALAVVAGSDGCRRWVLRGPDEDD